MGLFPKPMYNSGPNPRLPIFQKKKQYRAIKSKFLCRFWETSGSIYCSLLTVVHRHSQFHLPLFASTFLKCLVTLEYMRGTVALLLLSAKCRFRQMYSMNGLRGLFATSTPQKQENNEAGETGLATKEMIDPIVAFSRPPPLPPVIGPLVALSLLETWWNKGSDEDCK